MEVVSLRMSVVNFIVMFLMIMEIVTNILVTFSSLVVSMVAFISLGLQSVGAVVSIGAFISVESAAAAARGTAAVAARTFSSQHHTHSRLPFTTTT